MTYTSSPGVNDDRSKLLSSFSTDADTPDVSPGASFQQPRHRPGYSRITTLSPDFQPQAQFQDFNEADIGTRRGSQGLGIMPGHGRNRSLESDPEDLENGDRFNSNASVRSVPFSFSSTAPLNERSRPSYKRAQTSDHDARSGASVRSRKAYADFTPHMTCASREHIWKGASNHVYITLIVLAVFSTVFSGLYLGIAIAKPYYGKFISDNGNLTLSNANLLFALFAKLTELSFVTVFIAFVGQVISRRAFNKSKGYGVTLAEISMRGWVMQPGQMLVHPHAVKYAVVSLMGLLAILAALTAMLYTTATSALVSPVLRFSPFKDASLQNLVQQTFGDMTAVLYSCATPVRNDPKGISTEYQTCVAPQLSAQSNNDWSTYLKDWTNWANTTGGSNSMQKRTLPYSLVNENTVAHGTWIENRNITADSNMFSRVVNNVSLAMPHAGVIDAALNPNNSILQPKANDGFGSYNMHAAVMSPALNVICAEMNETELAPLVYDHWPHANKSLDFAQWANTYAPNATFVPSYNKTEWLNRTVVDEVFGFGPAFGQRRPPVFPRLPSVYNTLVNATGAFAPLPYRDAVYVLGANGDEKGDLSSYSLCQMRAYRTSSCSTWYNATSSSSRMGAQCDDPTDPLQFSKLAGDKISSGNDTTSLMWVDLGDNWLTAVSLGDGVTDNNAANSRLVTQFFPTSRSLDPMMPSMAEALAAMAANTLMTGTRSSPMIAMTDDEAANAPPNGQFTSRISSQQYGSGPVEGYQNVFYIVLFAVFGGNVLVLTWLILNRGLVTDFCDPANMFSLTINSPPSHLFAGSCGCGPEGKQYQAKWYVNVDGDHVYIENDQAEQELAENKARSRMRAEADAAPSPIFQTYSQLSKRKSIL